MLLKANKNNKKQENFEEIKLELCETHVYRETVIFRYKTSKIYNPADPHW